MAAIAYTTALQTRIAYALRSQAYSNLTADEKVLIDGTWSSGSLTGGVALDALTQIQQIGQWFSLTAPASVPSEWDAWFVYRTAMYAAQQMAPDRMQHFIELHDSAEMAALDAYARNLITYDPGSTPEASTLTVQNIRYYVIAHCVRRDPGWETVEGTRRRRPRRWIPFEIVDAQIERVIRNFWNAKDWKFKRRKVTMTIATDNTVTTTLSGETFWQMATRRIYFDDAAGGGVSYATWADGDEMASMLAYAAANGITGRPERFRFEEKSGTLTWSFYPPLDAQYTARAEVYVKGPTLGSLADTTTALARFPTEFAHVIKDAVLAEVLFHMNDPSADKLRGLVQNELDSLLPTYADVGRSASDQAVRDVYHDWPNVQNRWVGSFGL